MEVLILFFLGTAIGSFLNVVIDRIPLDQSIVRGRSYCDHCKKTLPWYTLIPLLSFAAQKGRSVCCKKKLSFQYPGVELLTGILFVGVYWWQSQQGILYQVVSIRYLELFLYLFVVSSLITLFFIDLKHGILPDKIVYPLIVISFLYLILTTQYLILPSFLSAAGAFLFFFLIHFATHGKGMGLGDVKLVLFMGLFLGFPGIVIALYFAFLTGALISCILIVWGKKRLHGGTIPFGPFLIAGTIVAMFWEEYIVSMVFRWVL